MLEALALVCAMGYIRRMISPRLLRVKNAAPVPEIQLKWDEALHNWYGL